MEGEPFNKFGNCSPFDDLVLSAFILRENDVLVRIRCIE